jgi:hypothetical protein
VFARSVESRSLTRQVLRWTDTQQLQLLSKSKDIKERSGIDGDVSMEQDTQRSSIDGAGDSTIQAKGEAEHISSMRIRKNILGMDPVFRSLGQKVRIIWQFIPLHLPGISSSQTKSQTANVRTLCLQHSHSQTLSWL